MSQMITLNRSNFDAEVLDSDQPVLVDYRADWCGPCRAIAPILEQITAERSGQLKVGKMDVDEEPELAQQAGAFPIPHLLLYRDGAPVARVVGALRRRGSRTPSASIARRSRPMRPDRPSGAAQRVRFRQSPRRRTGGVRIGSAMR